MVRAKPQRPRGAGLANLRWLDGVPFSACRKEADSENLQSREPRLAVVHGMPAKRTRVSSLTPSPPPLSSPSAAPQVIHSHPPSPSSIHKHHGQSSNLHQRPLSSRSTLEVFSQCRSKRSKEAARSRWGSGTNAYPPGVMLRTSSQSQQWLDGGRGEERTTEVSATVVGLVRR